MTMHLPFFLKELCDPPWPTVSRGIGPSSTIIIYRIFRFVVQKIVGAGTKYNFCGLKKIVVQKIGHNLDSSPNARKTFEHPIPLGSMGLVYLPTLIP